MKLFLFPLLSCLALTFFLGGCEKAAPLPDEKVLFQAIQDNAEAFGKKDVDAVMATIHPQSPNFAQTRDVVARMFSEVNLRFTVSDLKVVTSTPDEAKVSFVQKTEKVGSTGPVPLNVVEGIHILRPDDGKWKIYGTLQTKVTPLGGASPASPETAPPAPESQPPSPPPLSRFPNPRRLTKNRRHPRKSRRNNKRMDGRLIPHHRVRGAVVPLVFASALCLAMLVGRAIHARHVELGFYVWNLVLAWLPLLFALRVYQLAGSRPARWWPLALSAVLWFFFYPNAPYIVTDFLHLKSRPQVPMWFDIVMMMSFAWIGLFLGYLSLMLMQEIVRERKGLSWSWFFAVVMLALGSFGIYLGRFARWNSWDILVRPHGLAGDVINRLDLKSNPEMFAFLLTFF